MIESTNLIKEGKFEETLPSLNKILELDPQNFYALYNKAVTFNEIGKYEESIELSDKILKKDTKNDLALNLKANSFIELEKYDEALELIDKLLKKNSKNEMALLNKALVLSVQENYQDAVMYYENAFKRISTKGKLKFKGMPLRIMVLPSKLAEMWFEKGKTHQKLQQYDKALESFNKALKHDVFGALKSEISKALELEPDYEPAKNAREEHLKLMGK